MTSKASHQDTPQKAQIDVSGMLGYPADKVASRGSSRVLEGLTQKCVYFSGALMRFWCLRSRKPATRDIMRTARQALVAAHPANSIISPL